jgi:broad specificity phosphatase PhoE
MPDDVSIPQPAPSQATPATSAPSDIPSSYGDYLTQQTQVKQPEVRLPMVKRYELMQPHEKLVYDAADNIAKQFQKVSQPEFVGLADSLIKLHGNTTMKLTSLEPDTIETPEQKQKLDTPKLDEITLKAAREAGTSIQHWGDLLGKTVQNGTIIKIDDHFRQQDRDYYRKLKELNPTWTGEYVQMQSMKDGSIMPKAYNMASAFLKDPKAFSQELPGVMVSASIKKTSDADAEKFADQQSKIVPDLTKMTPQELDKHFSKTEEGFQTSDKVGLILKNNIPLSKILMKEPKLMENFRSEVANMEGAQVGQMYAQYQAFNRALEKTFSDKDVDPKAFEIYGAMQKFKQLDFNFQKVQNDLYAKMKTAGAAKMQPVIGDKMLQYQLLQARMLTNPKSITPDDKKKFAAMTLQLNDAIAKSGMNELQNDWYKVQQNNKSYSDVLKMMPTILEGAKDKNVQAGLDILADQQRGQAIASMAGKLFPQAEKFEEKQQGKTGKGSANLFKSLYRELVSSTQSDILALSNLWGGDKASFQTAQSLSYGGDIAHALPFQTAPKPTNTDNDGVNMLHDMYNFGTQVSGQIGGLLPAIALGTAGGSVGELSHFALPSYYETVTSLRNAGIPEDKARMVGITNMLLTAGTMKLAFMPSHIIQSQIEKAGIGELIEGLASKETAYDALVRYGRKFIPTTGDAKNAGMAMVQQVAMNVAQMGERKALGIKDSGEQNVFSNMAEMGAVVYALGVIGRLHDRKAATQMAKRYADENPTMFAAAMDEAKLNAVATGRFDLGKLQELESGVAKHYALQGKIPLGTSKEGRIAATDILAEIEHNKQMMATVGEDFRDGYSSKVSELQKKLQEVTSNEDAAVKHNNEVAKPAIEQLRKNFPAPVAPEFQGVVARHGQTDANVVGKDNAPDEPLNAEGKKQAMELGGTLKEQGITNLITSPLARSEETARLTGLPYKINNDLAEWNTGNEGKFDADFDTKHYVDHPDERPNGGETFNEFLGRVHRAKVDIGELPSDTAVITHGKVMKLWEILDKSGGKWDEKAKIEFLKDSNDFENAEVYKGKGGKAKAAEDKSGKIPFDTYKEHMMSMLETMKDSKYDWRIDAKDLSQKDREKGIADIKAGKDSAAAKKVEKLIKDSYDSGNINMTRGTGNNVERRDFSHDEWFGPYKEPVTTEEVNKIDSVDENALEVIKNEGITLENIDSLKHLFDGFPYSEADLAEVKDYLKRQGEDSARSKELSEKSEREQKQKAIDAEAANAPDKAKPFYEKRKALVDKYGKDVDDMIDELEKDKRLKVECPPGKRMLSLKNLMKR